MVEWELNANSELEISSGSGLEVLRQVLGLPIGGHLSAALVELVALFRERTQPWPLFLQVFPTMRYRDNFFVALDKPESLTLEVAATELSELLQMPVLPVGVSASARCLEPSLLGKRCAQCWPSGLTRTGKVSQGMWCPG